MSSPTNAAPFTYYDGFQDDSTEQLPIPAIENPTHFPLLPIYAAWGPTDATAESTASLPVTYGSATTDPRSPFFTTQTYLGLKMMGNGNQCMIQRLLPEDIGPQARLLLSLDIVAEPALQQYQRNSDMSYKLDQTGNKIPVTGAGATAPGFIAKWVLNQWIADGDNAETFGNVQVRQGSIVNSLSAQSQLYPMIELQGTFFGSKGNLNGAVISAPTTLTNPSLNEAQAERVKSFIYQLQFVTKANATSSPAVLTTQNGGQSVSFSLQPDAFDPQTNLDLDLINVIASGYSNHDNNGFPPIYGPFEAQERYDANIKTVLAMIGAAEAPHGTLPVPTMDATSDQLYSVNPFTAVNYEGVPYFTLQLQGPSQGGLIFTSASSVFATGATDGTMTPESYDADVATWAATWQTNPRYLDFAKYPFSVIYDSGYSLDTKKALMTLLGQRPDLFIPFTTQSVLDPLNTPDEDSSIAQAIKSALMAFPESLVSGTSVCRGMIISSAGKLIDTTYKGIMPYTLNIASMFSAYMGAGNAVWNSALRPDANPNNVVSLFKSNNVVFKGQVARSNDWNTGLSWVENFDTVRQYFPALSSVYSNDTSILKSAINVLIACNVVQLIYQSRRVLSGDAFSTDAQFAKRSNNYLLSLIKGRYDGRCVVIPTTFFDAADQAQGFSWSVRADMYGNNQRTVQSASLVVHRLSALPTVTTQGTAPA